jgi:hypothetical protein
MIRIPKIGLELLLVGGAAYLAWEHDQGRHEQAHLLCPICWINKIAPATEPEEASEASEEE